MRKLFALVLIALLLGVGVVALIETDPGYLLLAYAAALAAYHLASLFA